jgi:hypothetical protein
VGGRDRRESRLPNKGDRLPAFLGQNTGDIASELAVSSRRHVDVDTRETAHAGGYTCRSLEAALFPSRLHLCKTGIE